MRKQTRSLMVLAGLAVAAQGQTIFERSAGSYTGGQELAGQNNWTQLLNHDTNGVPVVSNQLGGVTFSVDNSAWLINDAASDNAFLVETNGSYVYLDEVSAGNELYSEWTGTMDFSFSFPAATYAAGELPNANFFTIGLTDSTTNGLSEFQQDDVCMFLRYRANNRLDMQLQTEQDADLRIFQTPSDATTYAEPAVLLGMNPQTGDCQSDELRLTWTIRKSTDGAYSAWGSVSNLSSGVWIDDIRTNGLGGNVVSTAGKDKSAAVYASSSPVLAMGRLGSAYQEPFTVAGNGLVDMDINDLTVVKSIVAPALTAPANGSAVAYDSQVTISWEAAAEATGYEVFRATASGGYAAAFTNLAGLSVVDAGLANGTDYFYVVQAVYPGFPNSTNSTEVSATPVAIFTGGLIDTSFTSAEGYSNGDLAGQQGWEAATGTDPNAFNITNATTTGEASTLGNGFGNTNYIGNAVYLDKLMDNLADDTLEGSMEFQVQTYLADGQTVATLLNADILSFGLTSDANSAHVAWDGDKALMLVRLVADGNIAVLFTTENSDASTKLAELQREDLGWDPEDEDADGVTTDDLVSETITLDWSIRKTRESGVYQAKATLGSSTATNTSLAYYTSTKQDMYDSAASRFTLGHYRNAWKTNGTLTNKADVVLEALSLTHTNYPPEVTAPEGVTTLGGDRSVTVSWPSTLEATSYDVLFAEQSGGSQRVIASVSDQTYFDSPRFNGVTNWYTVRANFDAGSADSAEVPGVPFASIKQIDWFGDQTGGKDNISTGQFGLDQTTGLSTNGGMMFLDYTSAPLLSGSVNAKYVNVPLYAIVQNNTVGPDISNGKGAAGLEVQTKTSNGLASDDLDLWANGSAMNLLAYIQTADWSDAEATVDITTDTHSVSLANKLNTGTLRLAIRNNGLWYAHETAVANGTQNIPAGRLDVANLYDENWAAIGAAGVVDPGTLLADPGAFDKTHNDSFTAVDAIGWLYVGATGSRMKVYELSYSSSGSVPSVDYWAGENGVTNLNEDIDGDLLSNLKEYAFGGDPNNGADVGTLPSFTAANLDGVDGFVVVHVELRDPAPGVGYSLERTLNLAIPSWADDPAAEELGTENIDYYFKAVTNFIPADAAAKFLDLKVNEL